MVVGRYVKKSRAPRNSNSLSDCSIIGLIEADSNLNYCFPYSGATLIWHEYEKNQISSPHSAESTSYDLMSMKST